MKLLKHVLACMAVISVLFVSAQDQRALITIDGEDISVDEFLYVFKKNNPQGEAFDTQALEEYLDLFINFKLKVQEAVNLGMDTVKSFQAELAGYRKQLAEPYFVNEDIIDEMLKEAYERKKSDLRASHILFRVGPNAMPEDTLAAYENAMHAINRIKKGEPFSHVATELSEDPSARDRDNPRGGRMIPGDGGDLGYFSVFDMVYAFETGAYNTPVGKFSDPVRTDFGYHIIKVTEKIPAQGSIEAAHLFLQMPDTAFAQDSARIKDEIFALHARLLDGEDFDELVREYSDDRGSASRGGILPKFNVNRMVPEFIAAISKLDEPESISEPVSTLYGWHIIRLINKSGIEPFEKVEAEMRNRVEKDARAQKSTGIVLAEIKNEYGYTEHSKAIQEIISMVDSTLYQGEWRVPEGIKLDKPVMTLGDTSYTQLEFARYIESRQTIPQNEKLNEYVIMLFREFSNEKCREYEDARLEIKYPDFRTVVREYHDGILLFELTNEKIWSFAGKDTVGLIDYYERHQGDFMWDTRLDVTKVTMLDESRLDEVIKLAHEGKSDEELAAAFNTEEREIIRIDRRKYQKGDNELVDTIKWKSGITDTMSERGRTVFMIVHDKVPPEPRTFSEARGLVIAGYQEELERKWIEELRLKYTVLVHQDVLESLTNK